jgi:hypothetical protein
MHIEHYPHNENARIDAHRAQDENYLREFARDFLRVKTSFEGLSLYFRSNFNCLEFYDAAGELHNERDLPARIWLKCRCFNLDLFAVNRLVDGANITVDKYFDGRRFEFASHGRLHRVGAPALIGGHFQEFWEEGHRISSFVDPSIEWVNGYKFYTFDDKVVKIVYKECLIWLDSAAYNRIYTETRVSKINTLIESFGGFVTENLLYKKISASIARINDYAGEYKQISEFNGGTIEINEYSHPRHNIYTLKIVSRTLGSVGNYFILSLSGNRVYMQNPLYSMSNALFYYSADGCALQPRSYFHYYCVWSDCASVGVRQ